MIKQVLFGPFAPDLALIPSSGDQVVLMQALNVRMSAAGGYVQTYGPTALTSTPVDLPAGVIYVAALSGFQTNVFNFMILGGEGRMYSTDNQGTFWHLVDASGVGAASSWEFGRYGNYLIAVSPENTPFYHDLTTNVAVTWLILPDSPPASSRIGIVREHIVLGNLTLSSEYNAIQWNSIGVFNDWPVPGTQEALAEEAGKQYLPKELGEIIAIVGMEEFGLVFQQYGITRMTYQGGNVVYRFDTFDKWRGCMRDNNTVVVGDQVYFHLRGYGFCATDGYSVRRIDDGYQESGSLSSVPTPYDIDRVYAGGGFQSEANLIIWKADGVNPNAGHKFPYYNIANGTFSHWDGLESVFDESSGSLAISNFVTGPGSTTPIGVPRIKVFGDVAGIGKMHEWNTLETRFGVTTGWLELVPGQKSIINRVTPIAHNFSGNPTIGVKVANDYQDLSLLTTSSGFTTLSAPTRGLGHTMERSLQSAARFHCVQMSGTSPSFDKLAGLRIEYEPAGPL